MIQTLKNLERDASAEVTPLDLSTWQSKIIPISEPSTSKFSKIFNDYGTESMGQNLAGGKRTRHLKKSFIGSAMLANHESNFKRFKNFEMEGGYGNPLRLYGGAPSKDDTGKTPVLINAQRFDKVLAAYQKAIDPRRQSSAKDGAPPYLIKLFDGSDDSLDGGKSPCGTRRCPSARLSFKSADNLFGKSQSVSCGLAGCPRIEKQSRLDAETEEKIAEFEALQRSATKIKSPSKCPSSFLPPIPPLQTIHWDCPDPLPKGGKCDNPQCPLKPQQCRDIPAPKGSCGTVKCPYSIPVLCGDECPSNQPEILPYSPPPPPPPMPCSPPPCYLPKPCYSPPPPCPPPPCYAPPPRPKPPCYLPHPCYPPPCPPPPCYAPHPYHPPPPCPPPSPRSCRNPRCPHSPPPTPPSCSNPRCPHSPPPCPPKPPTCANPRCPHSPPPCPPKPSLCPSKRCPFSP